MTKQVQRRRGTATQHTSFTGAEGEISVNTTNKSTHVHDGVTAGGIEAARADLDNVDAADVLAAAGITASAAELNRVDGVTSPLQAQIDAKAPKNNATFTGSTTIPTADINGGTIDGTVIGGTTPSAGSFTALTSNGIDDNATSTAITIDSSDNVGIGAINPQAQLHVNSGVYDTIAMFESDDRYGALKLKDSTSTASTGGVTLGVDGDALYVQTGSVNSNAMRIDSNGRVGIGTSSIESDATLHVDGTDTVLLITEDSEGEATLRFGDTQASLSQSFAIAYDTGGGSTFYRVNGTTVGRWNTGNDFLVGGDAASSPYTIFNANNDATKRGVGLRSSGYIAAANYGDQVMQLNRMNSDGEILGFRKDGTTVGSIGSKNGTTLTVSSSGSVNIYDTSSSAGGIGLSSNIVYPLDNSGSTTDNLMSLGSSLVRFKDLHLSGGVYLGGTGSANKLDDYEEGGYVIGYSGLSVNYTNMVSTGRYVKVGKLVTAYFSAQWDTVNIGAGAAYITLPFTPESGMNGSGNLISYTNGSDSGIAADQIWTYCVSGNANAYFRYRNNGTKNLIASKSQMFANGTNYIDGVITYYTSA